MRNVRGGFTLIELMMVVAIISLLATIAFPKFANLVIRSKEAVLRGNLGALRSAVKIYYCDTEGIYPDSLNTLTIGNKYLDSFPRASIPTFPGHGTSNAVTGNNGLGLVDFNGASSLWYYEFYPGFPTVRGKVYVNCTHADSRGAIWSNE